MCFQLIQILIFWQEFRKILWFTKCIQICEYSISFQTSRIFHTDMIRISKHAEYFLLNIFRFLWQINTVTQRLTHLRLTINSRETKACFILRKKNLRIDQCISINGIKFMYNLLCLLKHRELIFSYRYNSSLECCNICCLADRICEESNRDTCLKISHLDLILYSRISLQSWDCHKIHVIEW